MDLLNGSFTSGNENQSVNVVSPTAVAADANGRVFVAGSNTELGLFNGSTGRPIGRVDLGFSAGALAVDPVHGTVFAASWGAGDLSAVNATTLAVTRILTQNGSPMAMAIDPLLNELFVAGTFTSTIAILNLTTFSTVGSLNLGGGADALAFDQGADRLYAAMTGGHNVTIVDPGSNSVVGHVPVGRYPVAMALDRADGLLYVVNLQSYNVSVINTTTAQVASTVSTGENPWSIAYDPSNDRVYVPNEASNNITVLSGSTGQLIGSLPAGGAPIAAAYSPALASVLVANEASDNLTVVGGSSGHPGQSIAVGFEPTGFAVATGTGEVYVPDYASDNLTVLDPTAERVLGSVEVGFQPQGIAYDPGNGEVYTGIDGIFNAAGGGRLAIVDSSSRTVTGYVSMTGGYAFRNPTDVAYDPVVGAVVISTPSWGHINGNLSFLDPGTDRVVATVVGAGSIVAGTTAVDATSGTIYVAIGQFDWVKVVDPVKHQVLSTITVGQEDWGAAWDGQTEQVWVASWGYAGSGSAVPISLGNSSPASSTVSTGSEPRGLAWDPANGLIYVANSGSNNVTVIDPTTSRIVATVPVGQTPSAVAYDPTTGCMLVANSVSGTISMLTSPGAYALTFRETGLPAGALWGVAIPPATVNSTQPNLSFYRPNGTYAFSVSSVGGYIASPATGSVTIQSAGNVVDITFRAPRVTYQVTFSESGLPFGAAWSITFNGSLHRTTTASQAVTETNGSYLYDVQPIVGYAAKPASGTVNVTGSSVAVAIQFTRLLYRITFNESGLPAGSNWSVDLNGTVRSTVNSVVYFAEPNGSYPYEVSSVGAYLPSPEAGTATVSGWNTSSSVSFAVTPGAAGNTTQNASVASPPGAAGLLLAAGGIGLVIIAAVAVGLWRRNIRRKRAGAG